ncbi:MAG: hypothetical protein Q9201_006563 [Fulgogasparrea decipioides]
MPSVGDPSDASTTILKTSKHHTGGKRKREHSGDNATNATSSNGQLKGTHTEQLRLLFKDIIPILESYDIAPSILNQHIPLSSAEPPNAKRAKLPASPGKDSIASFARSGAYGSVDDLQRDLDTVIALVIDRIESNASASELNDGTKIRHERHPDVIRALAFKQQFNSILSRELMQRPYLVDRAEPILASTAAGEETAIKNLNPGLGDDGDEPPHSTVLTLFGGSGQPKQLFSSLKESDENLASASRYGTRWISEAGLPNGINFTKIIPVHSEGSRESNKETPSIGQRFAPPPSVQSLNPPRQSRHTATRSSSVNWYNPSEATTPSRPSRRDSYTTQPLTTGQWLTYNVAPSTKNLSSPESKRKQRDRALSFGEPQADPSEQTLALHRQAKEDALFRSVYSGFAPDRDNAAALVSEHSKNRLWWKRLGEWRYHVSFPSPQKPPSYDSSDKLPNGESDVDGDTHEVSLQEAVESWTPEEKPAEFQGVEGQAGDMNAASKGVEEILGEVSELLETLNSYQDVRNLSLANNARTPAGQHPQLSAMTGTPTSPSSDEVDIYNMLKSQLALMVASLPPFALARLDGEKLGTLNINTKIQVETKSYQGSLEEDEISTKGRQPAVSAAAGYPSRTSNAAVGLAPRNNYLAATSTPAGLSHRSSHMPPTVPGRSTTASSYPSNQQYSTRPPSANQYFANSARSSYPTQRPISSTPDRFPYSVSQQYGPQSARQSYVNGYNQYSGQSGTAYGQGYGHSQQPSGGARAPQSSYQQSSRPSQSYNSAPSPNTAGGNASPLQGTSQYASQGHGLPDSTPSRPRPPFYQQQSSQYGTQSVSSPQMNGVSNLDGPSEPQGRQRKSQEAADTNRPQAPLADDTRGNSRTAQAANANSIGSEQQKGASTAQQDGVAETPTV